MDQILKYFPSISNAQKEKFQQLPGLYSYWNERINVISRKDMESFTEHHVLHSLAIAKFMEFPKNSFVLDVGTGGGFPGIPLSLMFPEVNFTLIDSIGKKINVVLEIARALELSNVKAIQIRAEDINYKYDFIVSRAVTHFPEFYGWVKNKVRPGSKNGIICLKGGDLKEELKDFKKARVIPISKFFSEPYFETKKIVFLPVKNN